MANVSSATKFFPTAQEGFTTTTSGPVTSGAATVGLNSVAGYTNGDVVTLVVDPSDETKKQVFTGVVDTAGVQITGVVWTEGTNQDHVSGATVVDYETATAWALYRKGLLVAHDDDGTLKAGAVDGPDVLGSSVVTTTKVANDSITPTKWTNPYRFSAYRNSAWTALVGDNKVSFDTESYDISSNFDVSNGRFTAPVAGVYHFSSTVHVSVASGDFYGIELWKNGVEAKRGNGHVIYFGFATGFTVAADIQLAANDYVEVYFYNGSSANRTGNTGASNTFFDGHLVAET